MRKNTALINRVDNTAEQTTTFTVWADEVGQIGSFINKVVSVKGVPDKLGYQHDIGMGYWVDITVPIDKFDSVINNIKNVFKDSTQNCFYEDFKQTTWGADMLFLEVD